MTAKDTSLAHWDLPMGIRGYMVSVDYFNVVQTRAQQHDNLEVYLTVRAGDQAYPTLQEKFGEKEDEEAGDINCRIGPVPVSSPGQTVVLLYHFLNNGDSKSVGEAWAKMQDEGDYVAKKLSEKAAASLLSGKDFEAEGAILVWAGLIEVVVKLIAPSFPNGCDGLCAVGAQVFSGKSLLKHEVINKSKGDPLVFDFNGYGRVPVVSGSRWHREEYEIGGETPTGCGASPEYEVRWSIHLSEWSGWLRMPGGGKSALRLAGATNAGNLNVFAKGLDDGTIYQNQTNNGVAWSGWSVIPGLMTDRPLVAVTEGDRLWLFARHEGNRQLYCRLNWLNQGWTEWISLNQAWTVGTFAAAPFGRPEDLRNGAQVVLFRHGGDVASGQVQWSLQHDWGTAPAPSLKELASFDPWADIPMEGSGGIAGGLSAVNWYGTVFLFGVGRDKVVRFNMLDPNNVWRGWAQVGERFETDIDCSVGAAVFLTRFREMETSSSASQLVRGERLHVFCKPVTSTTTGVLRYCSLRSMTFGGPATDWTAWRDVPGSWANDHSAEGVGDLKNEISMGVGFTEDAPGVAVFQDVLYLLGEDQWTNLWLNTWDGTDRDDVVINS